MENGKLYQILKVNKNATRRLQKQFKKKGIGIFDWGCSIVSGVNYFVRRTRYPGLPLAVFHPNDKDKTKKNYQAPYASR